MSQKHLIKIILMIMLLFTLNTVQATLLSSYTFTDAIGNEATFEPDNQPNNATLSAMSRGNGLTPKKAMNTFNAQSWSTGTLDMTDYYALTIQPHCGFEMTLTSLTLDEKRSGMGIRNWLIRSSLDDFATDLSTFNVPDDTSLRNDQTITLNASFENLTGPVEFRIYGFNAESGAGTWRIDNLHINGNITGMLTKIHTIQGSGTASAEEGNTHTIEGVVVGDFQSDTQLKGFFVQEQDADIDDDPTTSEGLFVYNPSGTDVNVGDLVRVTGEVDEYHDLTELKNISKVTVCSRGASVTPATLNLPFNSDTYLERYEGMLVNLPQRLTVSNNYELGRYGQITLSSGRLMVPTQITSPGTNANAVQAQNDLKRIIIDDGSTTTNPEPILYPAPKLSATNTLRTGDTVTGVTGVLNYSYAHYRVQPTSTPNFVAANPRTATPPAVGGTLKVASFNVLNYFNGNGAGAGFPTSRGAKTAFEFDRQRQKIISAIVAMQADIIGLLEIENDGYGANSAIQDLVTGLNTRAPANTTYAFINPGFALGRDKIKVALIYRVETVTPIGVAVTTTQSPFNSRRPPLVQTFREKASAEQITVVVNHFKSKGGCPNNGSLNADQNDGQACWNAERVEAANTLTAWLATDPTAGGDNILIIGDLNAYAKEKPITVIKNAGYTDLLHKFVGANAYSYVYQAQAGSLDHAFASASLTAKVTGATEWHINADEPHIIDYKEKSYGASKSAGLYNADPYRASDHDPLIIGLNLANSSSQAQRPLPGTMGLSVEIDGYGTVRSKPSGIDCNTDDCMTVSYQEDDTGMVCDKDYCSHRFDTATEVKLIATATPGSVFIDWGGHHDCTDGNLWMINNMLCIAFFDTTHELTVKTGGTGSGVVYSLNYANQSTGIQCFDNNDSCSALFSYGTTTFLKAVSAQGSHFIGWYGDCAGMDNPLRVTMKTATTCIAYFASVE